MLLKIYPHRTLTTNLIQLVLINGEQLTELMIEHNLGVSTKQVYELKALDTDYFLEY